MRSVSRAVSQAVDKLPEWLKFVLGCVIFSACIYYIYRFGFWHFLLRLIFSP